MIEDNKINDINQNRLALRVRNKNPHESHESLVAGSNFAANKENNEFLA